MTLITKTEVLAALDEIVASKPDGYIYQCPEVVTFEDEETGEPVTTDAQCVYSDDERNPSCIVGHVFYRLAPDLFEKAYLAERPDGFATELALVETHSDGSGLLAKVPEIGDRFSVAAVGLLSDVQTAQDRGSTWREAVAAVDEARQ